MASAVVWWRSPVSPRPADVAFAIVELALLEQPANAPVRATGLWRLDGAGPSFGGYSALLALDDGWLRAFSDRGWQMAFRQPGNGPPEGRVSRVVVAEGYGQLLFDIESATRDAASGEHWLGFEHVHAIHRFSRDSEAGPVRALGGEIAWADNSGLESLVRRGDGSFVGFPENGSSGVIFAGDPTEGAAMATFPIRWPVADYKPTDAAQLPDGRVLVLMRRFEAGFPPVFHSLLVVGAPPGANQQWRPELLMDLADLLPRENYEGVAIRLAPGDLNEIWLISDDNFSVFQRTLLARLEWDGSPVPDAAQ